VTNGAWQKRQAKNGGGRPCRAHARSAAHTDPFENVRNERTRDDKLSSGVVRDQEADVEALRSAPEGPSPL
jgi:hypothetical protein